MHKYLHSTMYLFQLYRLQNSLSLVTDLHSTMYLFQHTIIIFYTNRIVIYIPLCIYFNQCLSEHIRQLSEIYIPLCIYFNLIPESICIIKLINLHSTMYLFQPSSYAKTDRKHKNLHSTMYLFQPKPRLRSLQIGSHLHSTMYLFQPRIFKTFISIRLVVALLSTKQTSIIFILTCSGNIWISTDKIRIVDLLVILQYYASTVKA